FTDCSIRRQPVARLVCDFQSSHLSSTSAASQKKLPCSSAWGRSHRLFNPASAGGQADIRHPLLHRPQPLLVENAGVHRPIGNLEDPGESLIPSLVRNRTILPRIRLDG